MQSLQVTNLPVTSTHGYVCVNANMPFRVQLEQVVKASFARAYGANIKQFMPVLCQLSIAADSCTLGLRAATQSLFIEQYLPEPIEYFVDVPREDIYELGNLCSTNRKATLAHFVLMNEALYQIGAKRLVFCATAKVRALLKMLGVNCTEIALANSQALDNPADWGTYYENKPTLCVVDLAAAHDCVINTPHLFNIKQHYHQASCQLASQLEA